MFNRLSAQLIFEETRHCPINLASVQNECTGALVDLVANNHCDRGSLVAKEWLKSK